MRGETRWSIVLVVAVVLPSVSTALPAAAQASPCSRADGFAEAGLLADAATAYRELRDDGGQLPTCAVDGYQEVSAARRAAASAVAEARDLVVVGREEEAVAALQQALEVDRSSVDAVVALRELLDGTDGEGEGDDPDPTVERAVALYEAGFTEEARAEAQRLLTEDPSTRIPPQVLPVERGTVGHVVRTAAGWLVHLPILVAALVVLLVLERLVQRYVPGALRRRRVLRRWLKPRVVVRPFAAPDGGSAPAESLTAAVIARLAADAPQVSTQQVGGADEPLQFADVAAAADQTKVLAKLLQWLTPWVIEVSGTLQEASEQRVAVTVSCHRRGDHGPAVEEFVGGSGTVGDQQRYYDLLPQIAAWLTFQLRNADPARVDRNVPSKVMGAVSWRSHARFLQGVAVHGRDARRARLCYLQALRDDADHVGALVNLSQLDATDHERAGIAVARLERARAVMGPPSEDLTRSWRWNLVAIDHPELRGRAEHVDVRAPWYTASYRLAVTNHHRYTQQWNRHHLEMDGARDVRPPDESLRADALAVTIELLRRLGATSWAIHRGLPLSELAPSMRAPLAAALTKLLPDTLALLESIGSFETSSNGAPPTRATSSLTAVDAAVGTGDDRAAARVAFAGAIADLDPAAPPTWAEVESVLEHYDDRYGLPYSSVYTWACCASRRGAIVEDEEPCAQMARIALDRLDRCFEAPQPLLAAWARQDPGLQWVREDPRSSAEFDDIVWRGRTGRRPPVHARIGG